MVLGVDGGRGFAQMIGMSDRDARQALLKEWRSAAEADNLKAEQLLSDYNKQLAEVRKSLLLG